MKARSLRGLRVHIAGSVDKDCSRISTARVRYARQVIRNLVERLVEKGANFVIPVDVERWRDDAEPVCFDWLVLRTIYENLHKRDLAAPGPVVVAVKHHKTDDQVPNELPAEYRRIWERMKPHIEYDASAGLWNMGSKRLEVQSRSGDVLIAVGGRDGVYHLANLYYDAGKPIIPLNIKVTADTTGAQKLYEQYGISRGRAARLFRTTEFRRPYEWMSRIHFDGKDAHRSPEDAVCLMEHLEPPTAFVVRLLNDMCESYKDVEWFFERVVEPVVEDEFKHMLVVVDGSQPADYPRMDVEIFEKLHRSSVVLADITGQRPNCMVELGYALGRGLPTVITARVGEKLPFDIQTMRVGFWKVESSANSIREQKRSFREHWTMNIRRPPLVTREGLIDTG